MSANNISKGFVMISGIAGLENPRVLDEDKPKSITFDAQLWVSGEERLCGKPIVAVLRYYNEEDIPFSPETSGYYFINANVAKIQHNPRIYGPNMELSDYAIVGDIIKLIPLGDALDARHHPVVHVCGAVTRTDPASAFFELAPDQYVGLFKQRVNFPARVIVKDSPRWGKKKPSPRPGSYVSVHGFLSDVARSDSVTIKYFEVELYQVAYLGKAPSPLLPSAGTPPPPVSATPNKRKLKIDMSTPCPPRPLKRARRGSDASSSTLASSPKSDDGGEPESDLEYADSVKSQGK